jgi:hypothetical protein
MELVMDLQKGKGLAGWILKLDLNLLPLKSMGTLIETMPLIGKLLQPLWWPLRRVLARESSLKQSPRSAL